MMKEFVYPTFDMASIELFEICQNAMNEIWAPQFEHDKKGVGRGDVALLLVNIEQ